MRRIESSVSSAMSPASRGSSSPQGTAPFRPSAPRCLSGTSPECLRFSGVKLDGMSFLPGLLHRPARAMNQRVRVSKQSAQRGMIDSIRRITPHFQGSTTRPHCRCVTASLPGPGQGRFAQHVGDRPATHACQHGGRRCTVCEERSASAVFENPLSGVTSERGCVSDIQFLTNP